MHHVLFAELAESRGGRTGSVDSSDGCVRFKCLWEQPSGNSEEAAVDRSLKLEE